VGVEEFAAFAAANADSVEVLSYVIPRNVARGFVSATDDASSFAGLASVARDIDAEGLASALSGAGLRECCRVEYPLPNGKILIRQDFARSP
jgi:hypothetical protein